MGTVSYELLDEHMTSEEKDFCKELGERVAHLRRESHMTQEQLASNLGIAQQQIASYEIGRRKIPVFLLPKIADALSVPVDVLLGAAKTSKRGPTPKLQQQIEQISRFPRGKQKVIMEMLDAFIQRQQKSG